MGEAVDYTEANSLIDRFISPRYREIDQLDKFVCGTQYKGRPNWWTAVDTPLAEREPCVKYAIARVAITSFVDLVLGEHRFPIIKIAGIDTKRLRKTMRRARFEPLAREGLAGGLGSRSACVIVGMRDDRPFLDTVPAKWCRPDFAADQRTVTKLEIEYPFVVEERDPQTRKWKAVAKVFRRVIDADGDTTYQPAELKSFIDDGREIHWSVDKSRTVAHKLGYCPVVWWACMRGASIEGRFDGHALHEECLDEITALDLSLSQRQQAAFLAGSPQWTEIGVSKGYNPSGVGRQIGTPATPEGGPLAGRSPQTQYVNVSNAAAARKKGPGNVWQYEDPQTKVELHQLNAGALEAISKNSHDIRNGICDTLAYVPLDPDSIPMRGLSGKAIEALKEKQLARCDYLRDDVSDGLLIPTLAMLCRVTGLKESIDTESVTIKWPPYYRPDAEDRSKELPVETAATTSTSQFVQRPEFDRVAKKRLARLVLDGASDEELEDVEEAIDEEHEAKIQGAKLAPEAIESEAQKHEQAGRADLAAALRSSKAPSNSGAPTPPNAPPATAAAPHVAGASPQGNAAMQPAKDPGGEGSAKLAKNVAADAATIEGSSGKTPEHAVPLAMAKNAAGVPPVAPDAHLRATSASPGVAETVYELLKSDYDEKDIAWIRSAHVEGPRLVPLEQVDFTNQESWSASHEDISSYVKKLEDGTMKPIVLVNEPNDEKLMIIDGHHRALAYEQLGQPAMAYIIHVGAVGGPWDLMHSSQKNGNGEPVLTSKQKA
jgi:hypothetical protein